MLRRGRNREADLSTYVGMAVPCPKNICESAKNRDASVLDAIEDGSSVCTCVCDDMGTTVLHLAAQFEAVTFARQLIKAARFQCDMQVTDDRGDTPLHTTSRFCQSPMNAVRLFTLRPILPTAVWCCFTASSESWRRYDDRKQRWFDAPVLCGCDRRSRLWRPY